MRIAIIGGGAAGMICVATLLEQMGSENIDIHLFEKNPSLGAKVIISGGGRCNVTTGIRDRKILLSKYIRGSEFLKYALGKFSPKACYERFEKNGVPLKIEKDLRVFPQSNDGKDVVGVFEKLFKESGKVTLHLKEGVIGILPNPSFTKEGAIDAVEKYVVEKHVMEGDGLRERNLISTGFHLPYNPELQEKARKLRNNMTFTESKIRKEYLQKLDITILRQKPIDNYIVDFYIPKFKLVIEIDGNSHYTEEGILYDLERTKILESYGLEVLRFTNENILNDFKSICNKLNDKITPFSKGGRGGFQILSSSGKSYEFDKVVLTTGGNAYSHTGSTGDGYAFAKALGHTITPLGPSLNSFETKDEWCKKLSGLSFPNAKFSFLRQDKSKKTVEGPMLFTHFGVSGPATFVVSAHTSFATVEQNNPLIIQWQPDANKTFEQWEKEIMKKFIEHPTKQIVNVLDFFFPERFAVEILKQATISPNKKCGLVTKDERKSLVHLLSGSMNITITARKAGDEFVTAGGVDTKEINSETMESRICPGLFFAGEIMNIDGVTGGFNLQASWATGRVAGLSILKS